MSSRFEGDSNAKDKSRDDSEEVGLTNVLESAGQLLTDWIRKNASLSDGNSSVVWNSQVSPRSTVMSFIEGMGAVDSGDEAAWARVLACFPKEWREAREEARSLDAIFDRLRPVNAVDFPGENESLKFTGDRYEVFPYALPHEWVWKELGRAPDGKIVLIRNGSDWIFSSETLVGANALLKSIESIPPKYNEPKRGRLFLDVFGPTFQRTEWWGWVALCLSIAMGFLAGGFLRKLLQKTANHLSTRRWTVVSSLLKALGMPLALLVGTVCFVFGLSFVEFTPVLGRLRWQLVQLLLLFSVAWFLFGMVDLISAAIKSKFVADRHEFGEMAIVLVSRAIRSFVVVIIVILALQNLVGMDIGALITGMGIVGLAISLAGKESAQNLFGALTIFLNRPFVVGDWIRFAERMGEVEEVGMHSTRIRLLSGELLVVPNMQFIDHEVENYSLRKYMRREMNIALPYGMDSKDIQNAIETVDETLRRDDIVEEGNCDLDTKPPVVTFSDFGDYYLNLKVYYWYFMGENCNVIQRRSDRGWFSYLRHCTTVNKAILSAFAEKGLEFAFPTQTLHMMNGELGPLINEAKRSGSLSEDENDSSESKVPKNEVKESEANESEGDA